MSNQDSANMEKVAKKLAAQLADAYYQLAQMTAIAEKLKEQRDTAINSLNAFQSTYVPEANHNTTDAESTTN